MGHVFTTTRPNQSKQAKRRLSSEAAGINGNIRLNLNSRNWLTSQPSNFYDNGIGKLSNRWEECVLAQGNHAEK